jgi:phosphate transport system ATP-binding protein
MPDLPEADPPMSITKSQDKTGPALPRPPIESTAASPSHSSTADPIALSTKGLSVWYGSSLAIRDINLDVPRNRITALIGPSGCGKSTLLRCFNRMNDLIPGSRMEGQIGFDGQDIAAPGVDAVSLRRRIGMVFQKPNPFPKSIYQNVAWGARINGYKGDMDDLVEKSLRRAAIWDEVKDKLNSSGLDLSGGQQQRLCIARTLAVEPEVILMDEPCSALDPIATGKVENLMDDLKADYTIVIVTHNMQQAKRVSDMTACMMLDDVSVSHGSRTGVVAEFCSTEILFTNPKDPRTEAYITGRIG